MSRRYEVVTFDCYGTLIDWETGIGNALAADASAAGHMISPRRCVEVYAEQEVQVEKEGFRKYREVLTEAARRTARRLGWEVAPERAAFLPRSLPFWQPFPDTNAALERLAGEGIRLGILSNVDEDLIAATRRHFTVPFELVVTAESVRSSQPGARASRRPQEARRRAVVARRAVVFPRCRPGEGARDSDRLDQPQEADRRLRPDRPYAEFPTLSPLRSGDNLTVSA